MFVRRIYSNLCVIARSIVLSAVSSSIFPYPPFTFLYGISPILHAFSSVPQQSASFTLLPQATSHASHRICCIVWATSVCVFFTFLWAFPVLLVLKQVYVANVVRYHLISSFSSFLLAVSKSKILWFLAISVGTSLLQKGLGLFPSFWIFYQSFLSTFLSSLHSYSSDHWYFHSVFRNFYWSHSLFSLQGRAIQSFLAIFCWQQG